MKVVSKKNCGVCITVKSILKKKSIQYTEFFPESDEGKIILNTVKSKDLPVLVLDDGTSYCGMDAYKYAKSL